MKYAIFSDIHGNLEALKIALGNLEEEDIDEFIFLGDAVGYGANPNEVVGVLRELKDLKGIAGNHDCAVINKFPLTYFNPVAAKAILWTKDILTEESISFLETLPLIREKYGFICVHGSLFEPQEFHYILYIEHARDNFPLFKERICFIGHTHSKEIYILKDGNFSLSTADCLKIEEGSRYIINVGSIGQPRDRDNRLCFCVYDDKNALVTFKRLEYNIEKTAAKIIKAGLPESLAMRLYRGF
ncbi:MAG: metallophosphoesterase family protein [Candidatus Omnitrophica bacterium]|nr:metallophosphoesterase family protein [Candidatus Omnitrophota bacterium]